MGKLGDYVNMAKQGLKNPQAVIDGNLNRIADMFGLLDEKTKKEAERRYEFCFKCPFNSRTNIMKDAGIYMGERVDEHCTLCGCPTKSKVMNMNEECPIKMIEQVNNENGVHVTGVYNYRKLWGKYDING